MSILGNIFNKVFKRGGSEAQATEAHPTATAAPPPDALQPIASSPATPQTAVDVGAVLSAMADLKQDRGGNYQSSIVDLLKLLDLDSSLAARKELAAELGINAGEHGSAEQNIALHRAVMDKLAANGGIVPDSLRN